MKEVIQPAIDYGIEGFPVIELIAYYMELSAQRLTVYPGFAEVFMPEGHTPRKGEVFKNPDLATTYQKIAIPRVDSSP